MAQFARKIPGDGSTKYFFSFCQSANDKFVIWNSQWRRKDKFSGDFDILQSVKKKHTKSKKSKICTHGLGKNLSFCWRKFLVTSPTCLGEADNI